MRLKYKQDYLSIKVFNDIVVENFTVITGLNGSGKSHLLNAINNGLIQIENIDTYEIILYNYNDFSIYNIDTNQSDHNTSNIELKNKFQNFQNKRTSYTQNINDKKNLILNSYQIVSDQINVSFNEMSLHHLFSQIRILEWNEKDIAEYNKIKETTITPQSIHGTSKYHLLQYYVNISLFNSTIDPHQLVELLKDLSLSYLSLIIIRRYNYSLESLSFEDKKEKIATLITNLSEKPNLNLNDPQIRMHYSHKFLSFLGIVQSISGTSHNTIYPHIDKIINEKIPNIYNELIKLIKNSFDSSFIKCITNINGKIDLSKYIQVEHGFLNLKELELEEKNYQIAAKKNEYHEFLNYKGKKTFFYNDNEFLNTYGESPVTLLNKVLQEYDCNGYEFRQTEVHVNLETDINQQNIYISLFNKIGNYETNLEDLSSGEKTILALAFSIYKLRKSKIIAKVFLMDEIDSALHPQMSKRLLNVLYNYFHKELDINIIMSTHSPSTVAFSPENSLFIMRKDEEPRLIKVNKDNALKELTLGVPSFSINYENRRQIFVESKYDVEYYESIYNIFKDKLDNDISLNFIASGDVRKDAHGQPISSCDIVKKVTETLRGAGNNSIFGIVDWDLSSELPKNNFIKVLGFDARYSIENFILDPLLVGILLMREKINKYKPEYFGLEKSLTLNELLNLDTKQCQIIIDKITSDFISKKEIKVNHKFHYNTIGNYNLQIPDFIKNMQGHKLEELYKDIYPELRGIAKNGENHFKNIVISKVFEDFKNFVPSEILKVLKDVQEI
ncbi:AAA family ATPase [uncultured Elizabethkingia sp.]|uniref:AAA family ATPase n=1 Tax=uncultured Elizabethkingia sp. TaxID=432638 RepID=UPI002595F7C0|nr:AAA family ATPase [uncultured Elizabethkingia sp.]